MLGPHMACPFGLFYWPDGWVGREKDVRDVTALCEKFGIDNPLANLRGLRLAVPSTAFQNDLSPAVADSFRAALTRLSSAGATVVGLPMAEFAQAAAVKPRGALTSAEAYSWHRPWMKDGADKYDPRVIVRIRPGETMTAANYIELMKLRAQFIRTINAAASGHDAMLMPTTPGHGANDRRSQQGRRNICSPQPAHAT
jgi:aspartyl-tRNA(Asn)/glutamyl-tRNA(Gln) amidotransferase subunit A